MEDSFIFRLVVSVVAALALMRFVFGKDDYDNE